eukprot:4707567-Amphidinium_carterae.1
MLEHVLFLTEHYKALTEFWFGLPDVVRWLRIPRGHGSVMFANVALRFSTTATMQWSLVQLAHATHEIRTDITRTAPLPKRAHETMQARTIDFPASFPSPSQR